MTDTADHAAMPCSLMRRDALADAMCEVRQELMLVDPALLVGDILAGRYANVADLVESSTELHFQEGTVAFGLGADVEMAWCRPPRVHLDMEFRGEGVTAFFRLVLGEGAEALRIQRLLFDMPSSDGEANTACLRRALERARRGPAPRDGA